MFRGLLKGWPLEKRFWIRVDKQDGKCWVWKGSCDKFGYGWIAYAKHHTTRAHRVSWELHNGPIPIGNWVLHKCDNTSCVNPHHLYLGTPKENAQDRMRKNRSPVGEQHPNSKLYREAIFDIRKSPESTSVLARKWGVNRATISRIRNKISWGWLSPSGERAR